MTEVYKKYDIDDLELLESIRGHFWKSKDDDNVSRNTGGIHDECYIGWPGQGPWLDNNPKFAEKLQSLTYPFDQPIMNSWIKFYNAGEYSGLHTDDVKFIGGPKEYDLGWTNSILIEQSSEIEGGDIVFAGDGWEPNFKQLKSRLITTRHKNIGDNIVWDSEVVHGVSEIKQGYRMTLIVVKERNKNG